MDGWISRHISSLACRPSDAFSPDGRSAPVATTRGEISAVGSSFSLLFMTVEENFVALRWIALKDDGRRRRREEICPAFLGFLLPGKNPPIRPQNRRNSFRFRRLTAEFRTRSGASGRSWSGYELLAADLMLWLFGNLPSFLDPETPFR
ncbi:hypothetical protein ACLOJK_011871 [Asimina triloba]